LPISAVDAINPAFRHAKQQLVQPFRFGQWARLALVGLLSGEMGSGGGCNSGSFRWPQPQHPSGSGKIIHAALPQHVFHAGHTSQTANLAGWPPHWIPSAGAIALLVLAGLLLLVVLAYISSVMRFILFDSVVAKECHIREGWIRHRRHGLQLFGWQILLMLATSAAFIVVLGIPLAGAWAFGWFTHPREHILALVLGGALFLLLFFVLLLALGVVHVMTKDFVVPQMALENLSAMEGWRRLWSRVDSERGSYAGYIGMKIVLAIGAGVLLGIVTFLVVLMLIIPVGGVGVIAIIAGAAAGLTWNFLTITLVVVACLILFAMLMFLASLISVPATVFFPAYSLYFFAPRYPPLAALMTQQVPIPTGPSSLPSEAPPLPPTSAPLG
jgi:hypothetical protein